MKHVGFVLAISMIVGVMWSLVELWMGQTDFLGMVLITLTSIIGMVYTAIMATGMGEW